MIISNKYSIFPPQKMKLPMSNNNASVAENILVLLKELSLISLSLLVGNNS
jgi:hypothetical protein